MTPWEQQSGKRRASMSRKNAVEPGTIIALYLRSKSTRGADLYYTEY